MTVFQAKAFIFLIPNDIMASVIKAVKNTVGKIRKNAQANKQLIKPRKRAKAKLDWSLSNLRHHHHFTEILRRRDKVQEWFHSEKKRLGVEAKKGAVLAREANRNPGVHRLLAERDIRLVGVVLDVAGVKGKKQRANLTALFLTARDKRTHTTVEAGNMTRADLIDLMKKYKIPDKTRQRVENAYTDFISALQKRRMEQPLIDSF